MQSLSKRIQELERLLVSGTQLGISHDRPAAVFVYDPDDELEFRYEVGLFRRRLETQGLTIELISLGELMWKCIEEHPQGPEGLFESEKLAINQTELLNEAHTLLAGQKHNEPGPLEIKVLERIAHLPEEGSVALLVRAGDLFPIYRTSMLLEHLMQCVKTPVVLFYPGVVAGTSELSFMGICSPSPNYRARILH
ncbi:BREX protein BrxB domain-containing protein [Gemmatimonadota bacterium]